MRFGIFTEAVTRYSKGQSPAQNDRILAYAMQKMAEVAGAKQASAVFDIGRFLEPGKTVETSVDFVNKRLGSQLSGQDMCRLLQNVEFETESDGTKLVVKAPFWRMDIEIAEDIVEEIGRLYGYNKLPVRLPKRSAKAAPKNQLFEFKQHLRFKLKEAGANEVLTYSFVHGDLLRKTGVDPEASAYHLRNALSPDLQYYRTSVLPSLLAKVHPNIKSGAGSQTNQFALFELGKAHVKGHETDGLPDQMERLAVVVSADDKTALSQQNGAPYYVARKFLDFVTDGQATYNELQNDTYPITALYQLGRSAEVKVGDQTLGVIGEFKPGVIKALKLPAFTAGFELDLHLLHQNLTPKTYQPLPAFPAINQDITLASDKTYDDTLAQLQNSLQTASVEHGYEWTVTPLDIYKKDGENTRFSFRLSFSHPKRTLTTDEISQLVTNITKNT
jgi:phenylalanyl-tRNA synthetase beta chain